MTRKELQRLYGRWVECSDVTRVPWSGAEYTESMRAVLAGVGDFLAEPDPTVEIAYLKAKLADVEAERDQLINAEVHDEMLTPFEDEEAES